MPVITLSDNSKHYFESEVSVIQVAMEISRSLSKIALAGQIDNKLVDLRTVLYSDIKLRISKISPF